MDLSESLRSQLGEIALFRFEGDEKVQSTRVQLAEDALTQHILNKAKEEFKVPTENEVFDLICIYFATAGHYFETIRLQNNVPIVDQIIEQFRSRTLSNSEFEESNSASLSSSSKYRHHNVFILCMTSCNDKLPRTNDEKIMRSLVQEYSPSALAVSSSQYSDLCALPELNEKTLLYHLKGRFQSKKFYTYVGTILISVNPYWMDGTLFGAEMMQKYQLQSSTTGTLSRSLEPHVFALGDQAFVGMRESKCDQCIVISGESGSGKTVAANDIIRFLMQLANQGHPSPLELMIANTSPILEAFGNAKTDHNDNSSRHGKYIQIKYKPGGIVNGARVQKYLLEKSRIVQHKNNERNYHVFFYLLASDFVENGSTTNPFAWLKKILHLGSSSEYQYLNKSTLPLFEQEDYESFLYLIQSMNELLGASHMRYSEKMQKNGILSQTLVNVFTVLAAILHLGNVQFALPESGNLEQGVVQIVNETHLEIFCELLHLPIEGAKIALQKRRHKGVANFTKHNTVRDAENARDTVAKALYSSLFDWIIRQINFRMYSTSDSENYGSYNFPSEERQIGILDIFGFEDIGQKNSFEQFCINFANEQLQFYFNEHIFNLEQNEYKSDGIHWIDVEYVNNKRCIDLFARRPFCLFGLLDEESTIYNGTNQKLLEKFEELGRSKLPRSDYFKWRPVKQDTMSFGIKHYAGEVYYNISEFREKNLEKTTDLLKYMRYQTKMFFLKDLCCQSPVGVAGWRTLRNFLTAYCKFRLIAKKKFQVYTPEKVLDMRARAKSVISPRLFLSQKSDSMDIPNEIRSVQRGSLADTTAVVGSLGSSNGILLPSIDEKSSRTAHIGIKRKTVRLRKIRDQGRCTLHQIVLQFPKKMEMDDIEEMSLGKICRFYSQDPERINIRKISKQGLGASWTDLNVRPKKDSSSDERILTISSQFTGSLHQLMESLNRCKPSFIRCIRSNTRKVPMEFDEDVVLRQLRYTGMLDTIKIRSSGYNVRVPLHTFIQEYRMLLPKGIDSQKADVQQFLSQIFLEAGAFQLGNSKVYLREKGHLQLQFFIDLKLSSKAQIIQRWWRSMIPLLKERKTNRAVVVVQRAYRKYKKELAKSAARQGTIVVPEQRESLDKVEGKVFRSMSFTVSPECLDEGHRSASRNSTVSTLVSNRHSVFLGPLSSSCDITSGHTSLGNSLKRSDAFTGAELERRRTERADTMSGPNVLSGKEDRSYSHINREDQGRQPIRTGDRVSAISAESPTPATPPPTPAERPQNTLKSPSYSMCQKCHAKFPMVNDTSKKEGQVLIFLCVNCQPKDLKLRKIPNQEGKITTLMELKKVYKSVLPDKVEKVLLKDSKDINKFTQFLTSNVKNLDLNEGNYFLPTLSSLKAELLIKISPENQSCRPFRPLKYIEIVKMFVDAFDKVVAQRKTSPNSGGNDLNQLPKSYLVRTFVGLLTHFENNQKLEVDYGPKRKRFKRVPRVREYKGHQLVEKSHSPQYSCACQRKKVDDFVSCTLCSVTIHKMCEGLLTDCKVAKISEDVDPNKFTGVPLELLCKRENSKVPKKLEDLLHYIEENGLTKEGIYRTNGAQIDKKRLLGLLDTEEYLPEMLVDYDVRTAADVVKFFFRSLPDPLFTYASYQRFLMAMDPRDDAEKIKIVCQHIDKLPMAHHCTLNCLVLHLIRVADKNAMNKMTFENLATVFSENLMFTETINLQGGAAMLATIQKKADLLVLILRMMKEKMERNMMFIEETERELGNIDQQLALLKRVSIDAGTSGAVSAPNNDPLVATSAAAATNRTDSTSNNNEPTAIPIPQNMSGGKMKSATIATTVPAADGPLNQNDPQALVQRRKITSKIRDHLVQDMTTLGNPNLEMDDDLDEDAEAGLSPDGEEFSSSYESEFGADPSTSLFSTFDENFYVDASTDLPSNKYANGCRNGRDRGATGTSTFSFIYNKLSEHFLSF